MPPSPPAELSSSPNRASRNVTWMTVGTATIGLSGYVYLSLVGHERFDAATFAALSSTYLLINIIGPGFFVSVEQETSRVVSHTLALNGRPTQVIRRMTVLSGVLAILVLLALGALSLTLLESVLNSEAGLLLALILTVIGSAAVFLVRGVTGGNRHFGRYAASVILDGGLRLVGCVGLALAGSTNAAAFGLTLAFGPLIAALVMLLVVAGRRRRPAGGVTDPLRSTHSAHPPTANQATTQNCAPSSVAPSWAVLSRGVSWLLLASLLAMIMANLTPVVVTASMPQTPAIAAGFAVALVLTRIPLLLMAPVQALLLPRLSRAMAKGERSAFRQHLRLGLAGVLVLAITSMSVAVFFGRQVISLLFGVASDTTAPAALALLALSAILLMGIQFLQPALVALRRNAAMAAGWIIGTVIFLLTLLALPAPTLQRALTAQIVGPLITFGIHWFVVRAALRKIPATPHPAPADTPGVSR